jgi:hypothetical protein
LQSSLKKIEDCEGEREGERESVSEGEENMPQLNYNITVYNMKVRVH